MATFGNVSKERLAGCDSRLVELMEEVVKGMDITILCGQRGEAEQNAAFAAGNSKLKYPQSKHKPNRKFSSPMRQSPM
jgi:peptidoglycan L-alanyl-D-glutamate endopeptidase CwlK